MNDNLMEKVKLLRLKVGAGMLDCKKALQNSNYDIDEAILYLRKQGLINMLQKIVKVTSCGLISSFASDDKKTAIFLEVNCETDFVSRSDVFINYVLTLSEYFLFTKEFGETFDLFNKDIVLNEKLNNLHIDLISRCQENILIRRVKKCKSDVGFFFSYNHGGNLNYGNVGSLVLVDKFYGNEDSVKDIAIQIVAMRPKYLCIRDIPFSIIEQEKKIYLERCINQGISEKSVLDRIIRGQLDKFYKDVVLLEQNFVKDIKINIGDYILNKFKVLDFVRFEVGEDI